MKMHRLGKILKRILSDYNPAIAEQKTWDSIHPMEAIKLFALEVSGDFIGHDMNELLRIIELASIPQDFLRICKNRGFPEYRIPGINESMDLLEQRRVEVKNYREKNDIFCETEGGI